MTQQKTVLVTGGAGFIGSHLCDRLLSENHIVICLDNLCTGTTKNIQHLFSHPHFKFIEHDVTIPFQEKVDQIYNLACPASPVHYQADPIKTGKTNVLGIYNMIELAQKNKATLLQASTSEVYGDPEIHPQPETYRGYVNPIGLRACYDEGKRMAETICFDYYRKYKNNVKVIRIFNTYGPRMNINDGRVVSNFIVQALQNKDITIYGNGKQTRSFQYIDDLIEGMIKMANSPKDFVGPVNLGNPEEFTIIELATKILSMTNSTSRLVFLPIPSDDPTRRKPIIELAKQKLKWTPHVKLNEGLEKTISYFRTLLETR